jgi:hypothetical protein
VRSFSSFLGEIDMEDMLSEIEDIDDFSEKLSGAETMEEDFFKEEIQKEAEKQIKELCEKQDYQLKKAELKLTKAYEIKSIKIKLKKRKNQTNPQEQPNIEQLKNKIADCLGVPIENISCKFS